MQVLCRDVAFMLNIHSLLLVHTICMAHLTENACSSATSQLYMQDLSWNAGKKMMNNVDAFLKSLLAFDKDNVPVQCVEKCEKDYISNPNFNADYIRNKSGAAAGLCGWVVNICKYFRIYQVSFEPANMCAVSEACQTTVHAFINVHPPHCAGCVSHSVTCRLRQQVASEQRPLCLWLCPALPSNRCGLHDMPM